MGYGATPACTSGPAHPQNPAACFSWGPGGGVIKTDEEPFRDPPGRWPLTPWPTRPPSLVLFTRLTLLTQRNACLGYTVPSCMRSCLHHRAGAGGRELVPGCPQMPGQGPAPGLLVTPEHEPPWAVLALGRTAGALRVKLGAPEIPGCGCLTRSPGLTDRAGEGAPSDVQTTPTGTTGWWGLDRCLVSMHMGWRGAVGQWSSSRGQEGRQWPSRPALTKCVTRWGSTGWVSGCTEQWSWQTTSAWSGCTSADPVGGFKVAQPWEGSENSSPARGQGGRVGGQDRVLHLVVGGHRACMGGGRADGVLASMLS